MAAATHSDARENVTYQFAAEAGAWRGVEDARLFVLSQRLHHQLTAEPRHVVDHVTHVLCKCDFS